MDLNSDAFGPTLTEISGSCHQPLYQYVDANATILIMIIR
jgi:hypothetical protein